ncbi:MAG: TetR family transcriptional regulator [Alphaproteobacteria bacterium]|nr:TetR family transcriptional regulator [Alphaproteobacteria bacterium]
MKQPVNKRNPKASRENILNAATAEFAQFGFDGARIDAIVRRANVSKNLAYHYFGGKEDLFLLVMERMYQRMREHHADLQIKGLSPIEGMSQLIRHTFAHFVDYPEVISLINSENLYHASHIKGSEKIRGLYSELSKNLTELLARGEDAGLFRKNINPIDLYISISALGYFYLSNQHTLGAIFEIDLTSAERMHQRENHIVEMILRYLKP